MSNQIYIVCSNFVLNPGGSISADYKGYAGSDADAAGYGPGGGAGGGDRGGGGGHGGQGGYGSGRAGGIENDSTNAPALPGSGGGRYGGAGGGLVTIQASGGNVTINGTVTANGASGPNEGGGGSGGGINIICGTFGGSSTGLLSAVGGPAGNSNGGGGGGGRIAVNYTTIAAPCAVRFTVERGMVGTYADIYQDSRAPRNGTLYFPDTQLLTASVTNSGNVLQGVNGEVLFAAGITNWDLSALTISNGVWVGFTNFTLSVMNGITIQTNATLVMRGGILGCPSGDLILTNGAGLHVFGTATNGLGTNYGALVTVGGALRIGSNGWVYIYSHPTNGLSPRFQLGGMVIATGGGINADYKGFLGKGVNLPGWGYGGGGGGATGGDRGAGGGHGGRGGNNNGASGGSANDSTNAPAFPGSAGGGAGSGAGGAGGGMVSIHAVSGSVTIDGTVTANGANGPSYGGAGAGGGIFIACSDFSGSGSLLAFGGNGTAGYGGDGGGGRVAIWYGVPSERISGIVDGSNMRYATISNSYVRFTGTISVTNGNAIVNLPPNGAEPGSIVFLTVARLGSVICVR